MGDKYKYQKCENQNGQKEKVENENGKKMQYLQRHDKKKKEEIRNQIPIILNNINMETKMQKVMTNINKREKGYKKDRYEGGKS